MTGMTLKRGTERRRTWHRRRCETDVSLFEPFSREKLILVFFLPQTPSHRHIRSPLIRPIRSSLHRAEAWPLAENYPHRYDAQLKRRGGSLFFYGTQNYVPEISRVGNCKRGRNDSTGTNRKPWNLRNGKGKHPIKKSRTIANQKTRIVL